MKQNITMGWQNYYDQSSMQMSRQSDTYQSRSTISLQAIIRSTKYNRHDPLCLFFCLSHVPLGSIGIRLSLTPAHGLNCKISHFCGSYNYRKRDMDIGYIIRNKPHWGFLSHISLSIASDSQWIMHAHFVFLYISFYHCLYIVIQKLKWLHRVFVHT